MSIVYINDVKRDDVDYSTFLMFTYAASVQREMERAQQVGSQGMRRAVRGVKCRARLGREGSAPSSSGMSVQPGAF